MTSVPVLRTENAESVPDGASVRSTLHSVAEDSTAIVAVPAPEPPGGWLATHALALAEHEEADEDAGSG